MQLLQYVMKKTEDSKDFMGNLIPYGTNLRNVNQIDKRIGNPYNEENFSLIMHREMRPE